MKKSMSGYLAFFVLSVLLSGCAISPTPVLPTFTPAPTNTLVLPTFTPVPTNTPTRPPVTSTPFVLFQDDFSKNSGRWETYGPWEVQDGMFQINISGADLPHAAAFARPVGGYNFRFEVDHMCESGGIFSAIYFRQTEMGAYFLRLFWDPSGIIFGKNDAGGKNDTNLQFQEFSLVTNKWYHLKVTAIENHFWFYIDDQFVMEYVDSQSPEYGQIVLTVYGEEGEILCFFDNVKVTEIY